MHDDAQNASVFFFQVFFFLAKTRDIVMSLGTVEKFTKINLLKINESRI